MVQILLILRAFLTISLFFSISISLAQVGINTTNPAEGSMLDITSSEKGVFIPRVNIVNLNNIDPITGVTTPANANGLLVYNTNTSTGPGFFVWNGGNWEIVGDNNDDWKRSGNSGTTGTEFIGTTDGQPLLFKTNNSNRFEITANGRLRSYNSGSQGQPSYSWNNSNSTGMFRPANNQLGFSTDGTERARIDANGDVGIGDNSPDSRLHISLNQDDRPALFSEITVSTSAFSAGEFYNPNTSNGIGTSGIGFAGVYGDAINTAGWAGYFAWDTYVDWLFYSGATVISDRRLKSNIKSIENPMGLIERITPVKYNKKRDYFINKSSKISPSNENKNVESIAEYGFIAQDMEKIIPELVQEKEFSIKNKKKETIKGINYIGLIPILTKAIQEQQEQIKFLEQRIESLERAIKNKN